MIKRLLYSLIFVALLAAGCSSEASTSTEPETSTDTAVAAADGDAAERDEVTDDSTSSNSTGSASTALGSCDDVAATFVTRGSANPDLDDPEVSATCSGDSITITANGIPDYTYIETSPGAPRASDLEYSMPAEPQIADETTAVPLVGTAAVAINGVPIYGPTEGTGGDVLSLAGALSECGSHNGPTGFHMHLIVASANTDCLVTVEAVAQAPQLVGYAFDGFPIYTGNDQYTSSWEVTDESLFATDTWAAHTYVEGSGDLDECNGLTDDAGNYAYYTTDTFPYVLGCYSGVVDLDASGAGGGGERPDGPPPADDE